MTYKLIGLESFISKKGIGITKLHCVYNIPASDKLVGKGVELFFILTDNVPEDLCIDSFIEVYFGRQGSQGFLAGLKVVDKK